MGWLVEQVHRQKVGEFPYQRAGTPSVLLMGSHTATVCLLREATAAVG